MPLYSLLWSPQRAIEDVILVSRSVSLPAKSCATTRTMICNWGLLAMSEFAYPLKLKYRNPSRKLLTRQGIDPAGGTLTYNGGNYGTKKGGNSGSGKSKALTLRPRMRAYWGNVLR